MFSQFIFFLHSQTKLLLFGRKFAEERHPLPDDRLYGVLLRYSLFLPVLRLFHQPAGQAGTVQQQGYENLFMLLHMKKIINTHLIIDTLPSGIVY